MAPSRIFVSHSHVDNAWSEALATELRQAQHDVWIDIHGLLGGMAWHQEIDAQLQAREIMVIVLTPMAWKSEWVQKELRDAFAQRKQIIPVLHKQTKLDGAIREIQWIDARNRSAADTARDIMRALLGQVVTVAPLVTAPRMTRQGGTRVKADDPAITIYYTTMAELRNQRVVNELGLRRAFETLLTDIGRDFNWTLVAEARATQGNYPDATLRDANTLPYGYWEAKDSRDNLEDAMKKKIAKGYPTDNIIFEDTRQAILVQNGQRVPPTIDLTNRQDLADLLTAFFTYQQPAYVEFTRAVAEFKDRVPALADGLLTKIRAEHQERNTEFTIAFDTFREVCKNALDRQIPDKDIDTMLVQHLLTERLFRTVFDNADFVQRNVIAREIERVIQALTARKFNRGQFLAGLDRFYGAIENAARTLTDYSDKQGFLNTVYEQFFQGFDKAHADTHGIVYTPQPIVDFMCNSIEEVLQREFGRTLADRSVKILDPCTGTGSFVVNLLNRIPVTSIAVKYREDLFCNEIMLLPYYIASMNIEHAYYARTEEYQPFEGICFVDTLEMEGRQGTLGFNEINTERIQRQQRAPLMVIVGNPPYNVGQQSENDNNKNRRYDSVEGRVRETYARDSAATNRNALNDAYVKFFRWASDRMGDRDGIVCFVTNNSFVEGFSFDGMRKALLYDFTQIYHLDLHGNVRRNPKLSGTTHNVFGIQVGVGITIAIKNSGNAEHGLWYHRVPSDWKRRDKFEFLAQRGSVAGIAWQELTPDAETAQWLTEGMRPEFGTYLPLGTKAAKAGKAIAVQTIFKNYGRGVATSRDDWVYDFDRTALSAKTQRMIEAYNTHVDRWKRRSPAQTNVDDFVTYDDHTIKWSRDLKLDMQRGNYGVFSEEKLRQSLYRPYCKEWLFFDRILNEEVYQMPQIFPTATTANTVICVSGVGTSKSFHSLASNVVPDLHTTGDSQCFPLYTYADDGSGRQDNITAWAVAQFQGQYGADVTRADIFHYVYALLHHATYREYYAENLKHELPRLPLVGSVADWQALVRAGERLATLHTGYEQQQPFMLQVVQGNAPFTWNVSKMHLTPDRTAIAYNDALTLAGVPAGAFDYRLGNRSALEWVIDQYQLAHEKRSGLVSDPNRYGDEQYIYRLLGQVIAVSLETNAIVAGLPRLEVGG